MKISLMFLTNFIHVIFLLGVMCKVVRWLDNLLMELEDYFLKWCKIWKLKKIINPKKKKKKRQGKIQKANIVVNFTWRSALCNVIEIIRYKRWF